MLVVAVAVIGSLTVLPAILSWLGDRVEKFHVPFAGGFGARTARDGSGARSSIRYPPPDPAIILAATPLVALALVCTQMKLAQPGPETFPDSLPAVDTYKKLQAAFPGGEVPAEVVVKADDVTTPQMRRRSAR